MPRRRPSPAALLAELVARPSIHPAADTAGTPPGEAAVARWLAEHLRSLGAGVEMPLLAPGRPMVVAAFEPASKPVATIALVPHLDTVGVAGMTVPPFRLTRRGDRLHGRGACDTKGPIAALLSALDEWTRLAARSRGAVRWLVAATAGEEAGGLGAQELVHAGFSADFVVALEPTRLRVVHAAKGLLRVWIDARGRAAHGSTPEAGVNAIERLLPLAAAIGHELAPALARRRHPLLGRATVNLGALHGGTELNIVPESARLGLDIRTHPRCTEADALKLVERIRRRHARGSTLTVQRRASAFVTPRESRWARQLRQCARGWDRVNWFCDANIFASQGIPSVAFGPGDIAQAHTHDEYITVSELEAGARAFLQFLRTAD
jgi:acetylornithine deacetylase/succinyl-diaminopimelate desuccinylase-like protein